MDNCPLRSKIKDNKKGFPACGKPFFVFASLLIRVVTHGHFKAAATFLHLPFVFLF